MQFQQLHIEASDKIFRRFDLADIIFKFEKKKTKTLPIRSKITRENIKSDKNVETCTMRYKR